MSVRQSLLAILDQGPCYGYQLRTEFDRRTGSTWPLNVGQIYNTLERLERDGLVRRAETDEHGHVYWSITPAGSSDVARWLASPVIRTPGTRDELAIKLAVAVTLPGVDAAAVISGQREASLRRLEELRSAAAVDASTERSDRVSRSLIADSLLFAAEAEVRWLAHVEQRLAIEREPAMTLATERPKRGRPARPLAAAGPVEPIP